MKTTKDYLEQTSKHLFKFESLNERESYFMKVTMDEDKTKFSILKFKEDLTLIDTKEHYVAEWEETSPAGKMYVPCELKDFILFYHGHYNNYFTIRSIKHFKSIMELIDDHNPYNKMEMVA